MKEIQSQLIKPFVEKMEREWQALYDQVRESSVPEAQNLKPIVQTQLEQLRSLLDSQVGGAEAPPAQTTDSVHDFVRRSKMDLRSAERRWRRHLVSTERVKTRHINQVAKFSSRKDSDQR